MRFPSECLPWPGDRDRRRSPREIGEELADQVLSDLEERLERRVKALKAQQEATLGEHDSPR